MRCWLVKSGVPYDVAFEMDEVMLWAHWIALAEFERPPDEHFNFVNWDWNKSNKT